MMVSSSSDHIRVSICRAVHMHFAACTLPSQQPKWVRGACPVQLLSICTT